MKQEQYSEATELPIKLSPCQQQLIEKMKEGEKIFAPKSCVTSPQLSISKTTVPTRTFKILKDSKIIEQEGSTAVKVIWVLTDKGKNI